MSWAGSPHAAPSPWQAALSIGGDTRGLPTPSPSWGWLWLDPFHPHQNLPWTSGSAEGVVPFQELTALREEIPGDGTVGGEESAEGRRGAPPPLILGSVLGAKGGAKAWPLKQEKLELALNSERVCWGLASCGLPQASRQAAGLCLLGSQAAGQAAASSMGSWLFLCQGWPWVRRRQDTRQKGGSRKGGRSPPLTSQSGKAKAFRV